MAKTLYTLLRNTDVTRYDVVRQPKG